MLDGFLLAVNAWMAGSGAAAGVGAFLWGLASVLLSPCHLASIPLVVGYVAGQNRLVTGVLALRYAAAFSLGLFVTIAAIGAGCAVLGRMLGDVGPVFPAVVGGLLLVVSLDMLGVLPSRSGGAGLASRLRLRGLPGALVLGLAYGGLSGACTFGFLAPILAVVTIQGQVARGTALAALFALGHCLPILVAGSCAGAVSRSLENAAVGRASRLFRRGAALVVGGLGLYFLLRPLVAG
ncbi:cytochrome c biogenesis CcdA family protein [Desulfovibrio sp. TomC]|uniref:cytochrome c biogenesis CcdA family protein n=1 Tax=Desulfovibrio sp. TomC TaxID=1562888 RepID=UPI000574D57C|nr:cytochrome c biogenesis protein CcdA [Desulfovibrio sp. TomC]KHK01903.1 hypothetical protein NY78_2722 [Desulfovibrio sp. TomC]